jgi:hypothetical protein
MVFSDLFDADQILLTWSPPKPELGPDGLYLITIQYNFQGETYTDYAWTQQPQWSMGEHSYLGDLSEDGLFRWSVVSIRQTGTDGDGVPVGPALSRESAEWSFVWKAPAPPNDDGGSDDDDDGDGGDGDGNGGGGYP